MTQKNLNSNVKLYEPEKCAPCFISQVLFMSGPTPTFDVCNLFVEGKDIVGVPSLALCEETK